MVCLNMQTGREEHPESGIVLVPFWYMSTHRLEVMWWMMWRAPVRYYVVDDVACMERQGS